MIAGTLEIQLLANMARLQSDMDAAKRAVGGAMGEIDKMASMAKSALGALGGVLSVGMFAGWVKGAIDAADNLNDLSKSTGIAVEQLAGLKLASKQSGAELEGTAQAINKLSVKMGENAEKYAKIGITAKQPLEAFKQLADIFNKIDDPQKRAAFAAEALGKSWGAAAPLLAEGSAGIQEMVDKGAQLSGMTQTAANQADAFNDRLAELETMAGGAALAIGTPLVGALLKAAEGAGRFASVGAAAVAAFVVAPAIFATVATSVGAFQLQLALLQMELAGGTTLATAFGASLGGIVLPAEMAAGALGVLKVASGVLFAAFAGWQIGSWLQEQFLSAKLAGIALVDGLLTNWERMKFGFSAAVSFMQTVFGGFVEMVGEGLSAIPGFGAEGASLAAKGVAMKGTPFAQLAADRDAAVAAIHEITDEMADYAIAAELAKGKSAEATKKLSKAESDAVAAYIAGEKEKKAAKSALETADASFSADAAKRIALLSAEAGATTALTETQKWALEIMVKIRDGLLGKTEATRVYIGETVAAALAQEKLNIAEKVAEEQRKEHTAAMLAEIDAQAAVAKGITDSNKSLREQTAEIGLTADALAALKLARVDDAIAIEQARLAGMASASQNSVEAETIRETIAALEDRKVAMQENDRAQKAAEAIKAQGEAWKSIEDTAHQTFVSIFDSGKSAFDRLTDTLKNGLLDLLYQMTLKKWIISIAVSASGTAAAESAFGTAATGATSSLGSIGSLASGAKTAYDMFSSGASTTYTKLAESGIGQSLGLSTAQSPGYMAPVYDSTGALISEGTGTAAGGLTTLGTNIGSGLASMGAGILGSAIGSAIAGDYRVIKGISGSTVGAGVGAAVGSIVPVIGTAVGAAVGGILGGITDRAFGMQEKKQGETGIKGTFTGSQFAGSTYSKWTQKGGWFRSDDGGTDQSPLDSSISSALGASFTLLKLETGRLAEGLGVDTAKIASYSKYISVAMTGDSAANAKALSDAMAGINNELAALVLSGTNFALANETSSETLNRLYNSLTTVNQAFDAINVSAYATSLAGGDMASQLALAMGGLDAFKTSVTSYYDTYFSAGEKQADLTAQVTASFAAMGVTMPSTEAGLRKLVEGLDMTTTAGRATFAGVMSVEQAFSQMTADAKKLADSRDTLMQKYADPSVSSATAIEYAKAAIKKAGVIDIDGLDANGIRSQLRQVIFGATQDTIDAISGLSSAFDTVIKGLDDAAEAAKAATAALKASAQTIIDDISASFKAAAEPAKADTFGLSAAEVAANQTLVDALNNATAGLGSLKSLGLDEKVLAQYTDQLKAIISEQTKVLSVSVMKSRTLDGDLSGALASALSTVMPSITAGLDKAGNFVAASFNRAMEDAQAKAAVMVGAYAAANALSVENYQNFAGMGASGARSSDYLGTASAQAVASSDYGTTTLPSQYALRSIVAGAIAESARTSGRDTTGLNGIYAARSDEAYLNTLPGRIKSATDAIGSLNREFDASQLSATQYAAGVKMVSDTMSGTGSGINSLSALDQSFNAGKITAAQYATSVKEVSASMSGAVFSMPTAEDYAAMQAAAAEAVKSAGYASLQFYFGKLDGLVSDLADAAAAAATPLAQVNSAIGLLKSAATVFGQSAAAAAGGESVDAGSDVGKAQTIADAAARAAGLLTTQTSQAVQNTIALSSAFADMSDSQRRDTSLMLDGIGAFDNTAFYNSFLKLSDALKKGGIDTAQYTELFQIALDTTTGAAAEAATTLANIASERAGLESQLLQAQGDTAAIRAKEIAALDASNRAIQMQIYALADQKAAIESAQTHANAAYATLERAVAAQRKAAQAQIDSAQSSVTAAQEQETNLKSIFDNLKSSIASLYGAVDSTSASTAAEGNGFIANALSAALSSGRMPDASDLADAISASMKGIDAGIYASQVDADSARLELAGQLSQLQGIGGTQLTAAEQQLTVSQAALKAAQDQLASYDDLLTIQKAQLDVANGIDTSVISVADAVTALGSAITSLSAATSASATSSAALAASAIAAAQASSLATATAAQTAIAVPVVITPAVVTGAGANADVVAELREVRAQLVIMQRQLDVANASAARTANATNGNQEHAVLVEIAE